ncbi:MAG: hypothetical protein JNK90_30540, partial [Planctomycetaceae bacterium]|nr:hypothetical protein [Planctomycetaceae bacterium]
MDSSEKNEDELKLDSAWAEYMRRCDEGEKLDRQAFASQFPEIAEQLLGLLEAADALEKMAGPNGSLTSLMSVVRSPVPTPPVDDPLKESTLPVHFDAKLIDEPQGSMDITVGVDVRKQPEVDLTNVPTERSVDTTAPKLPMRFGEYTLEKLLG